MRNWKIASGRRCRLVAVLAITVIVLRQSDRLLGGTAGAATPSPAMPAMPVPVTKSSRRRSRSTWTIRRARNRSATSRCRPRSPAISSSSTSPDGADVKEGDLLYTIDPRDLPGGARPGQGPGAARQGGARLCALAISTAARARQERLPRQGQLRPAHQRRAAGRGGARDRSRPRSGRPSSISPIPKSARPSPAGSAATRRRSARWSASPARLEHAGAARPDLRHLQPERDGPRRDPEGAGGRQGRGRSPAARRDAGASQGRAHLPRQRGRPLDRHDRGARHDRQRRSQLAARPICPRPAAHQDRAGCADGAADGARARASSANTSMSSAKTTRPTSVWFRSVPADGDLVAVLKGVSEGDQVITGNLQKIGPGAAVQPSLQ